MLTHLKQTKTIILLVLGIISTAAALIIGIADNLPGIILSYLSGFLFILVFTYHWRKPKPFAILAVSSIAALIIFAILHNLMEALKGGVIFGILGAGFFLIAVILCPAGIIIGFAGGILNALRQDREKRNKR